jgi:hypothetical protein
MIEWPFSRAFWSTLSSWASCLSFSPQHWNEVHIQSWFISLTAQEANPKGVRSLVILAIWTLIWKERNNRIFQDTRQTVQQLVDEVRDTARLWVAAGANEMFGFKQKKFYYLKVLNKILSRNIK